MTLGSYIHNKPHVLSDYLTVMYIIAIAYFAAPCAQYMMRKQQHDKAKFPAALTGADAVNITLRMKTLHAWRPEVKCRRNYIGCLHRLHANPI